ncbi:MAG: FkbM family methyltransferase [Acetobacteraceae bacterium]|nr:FkbM family methyltransferase [Acetobacteraceae bacterium]
MKESTKRLIRTAQTYVPWLADAKAEFQYRLRSLARRPFEPDFAALRLFGGEDRLHLDVGANRGQSIAAIRLTARRPRIMSFEPNPVLAARLVRRFGDLPGVRIEPVGLGDREGEFELHIPYYRGYVFDGLASIDRDAASSWLSPRTIHGFDPAKLRIETVRCRVVTLDSLGTEPFFIKLDVQGFELPVLRGAEETLRRHRPVLLIETPDDTAVLDHLAGLGYRPYAFDAREGRFRAGRTGVLGTFFLTDDKADPIARFIDA